MKLLSIAFRISKIERCAPKVFLSANLRYIISYQFFRVQNYYIFLNLTKKYNILVFLFVFFCNFAVLRVEAVQKVFL